MARIFTLGFLSC